MLPTAQTVNADISRAPILVEWKAEYVDLTLTPRNDTLGWIPVVHRTVHGLNASHIEVGGSAAIVECDSPILFHYYNIPQKCRLVKRQCGTLFPRLGAPHGRSKKPYLEDSIYE